MGLYPNLRKQRGFSLAELMIAMVAGLIVSAAVLSFFLSGMRNNGQYVQSTRLTQELRNSMNLITRELRRAGFDRNYLSFLAQANTSPFSQILLDVPRECVVYAYDKANNNRGVVDNGEVHAIRRISTTYNNRTVGVIEYAESAGGVKPACTDGAATYSTYPPTCNGVWCAMSDPSILNITQLTFADNRITAGSGATLAQVREIGIDLRGQLAGSTEFTRGLQARVRVRADCTKATIANCNATP